MQRYAQQLLQTLQGLDQEKLAQWASMGLLVVVSYAASVTTWNLVSVLKTPEAVTPPPMVAPRSAQPQPTQATLSAMHLFGSSEQAPSSGAIDAPETRLNLTLNGVIASTDKRIARAFIATAGSTEKSYSIDATLPGGAVLKEIHPDRVILLRSGRYETLRMPKKVDSIVVEDEHPAAAASSTANRIQPKVTRDEVLQYKQKLLTAPNELAGAIRQRPVRRDGKIIGYRLFPGSDKDVFNRLGLKPGDIVTGVNGMPLSDPASAMALYGQLPQMSELNIEVQRAGQSMSLVLPWN